METYSDFLRQIRPSLASLNQRLQTTKNSVLRSINSQNTVQDTLQSINREFQGQPVADKGQGGQSLQQQGTSPVRLSLQTLSPNYSRQQFDTHQVKQLKQPTNINNNNRQSKYRGLSQRTVDVSPKPNKSINLTAKDMLKIIKERHEESKCKDGASSIDKSQSDQQNQDTSSVKTVLHNVDTKAFNSIETVQIKDINKQEIKLGDFESQRNSLLANQDQINNKQQLSHSQVAGQKRIPYQQFRQSITRDTVIQQNPYSDETFDTMMQNQIRSQPYPTHSHIINTERVNQPISDIHQPQSEMETIESEQDYQTGSQEFVNKLNIQKSFKTKSRQMKQQKMNEFQLKNRQRNPLNFNERYSLLKEQHEQYQGEGESPCYHFSFGGSNPNNQQNLSNRKSKLIAKNSLDQQNGDELYDSLDENQLINHNEQEESKLLNQTNYSVGSECNISSKNHIQESRPQLAYKTAYTQRQKPSQTDKRYRSPESNQFYQQASPNQSHFTEREQQFNRKFTINALNLRDKWESQNFPKQQTSQHQQVNQPTLNITNIKPQSETNLISKQIPQENINQMYTIHKFKLLHPVNIDEFQVIQQIQRANKYDTFKLKDIKYKYNESGQRSQMIIRLIGEVDGIKNSVLYNQFSSICKQIKYSNENKQFEN